MKDGALTGRELFRVLAITGVCTPLAFAYVRGIVRVLQWLT